MQYQPLQRLIHAGAHMQLESPPIDEASAHRNNEFPTANGVAVAWAVLHNSLNGRKPKRLVGMQELLEVTRHLTFNTHILEKMRQHLSDHSHTMALFLGGIVVADDLTFRGCRDENLFDLGKAWTQNMQLIDDQLVGTAWNPLGRADAECLSVLYEDIHDAHDKAEQDEKLAKLKELEKELCEKWSEEYLLFLEEHLKRGMVPCWNARYLTEGCLLRWRPGRKFSVCGYAHSEFLDMWSVLNRKKNLPAARRLAYYRTVLWCVICRAARRCVNCGVCSDRSQNCPGEQRCEFSHRPDTQNLELWRSEQYHGKIEKFMKRVEEWCNLPLTRSPVETSFRRLCLASDHLS